jgi:hypothetical protein
MLWMPDYNAPTGAIARLRINVSDAEGLLCNDMAISVTYDTNVLTAIDVEKTALTDMMTVSNNVATAAGVLNIVATGPLNFTNITVRMLGCEYEQSKNKPAPVYMKCSKDHGNTWSWINSGKDINRGTDFDFDIGEVDDVTNCVVSLIESIGGKERRSDQALNARVLVDGDSITNIPLVAKLQDVKNCLQPYIDSMERIKLGPRDRLYMFQLSDEVTGPRATFQDVIVLVECNKGAALNGAGHLFDALFRVNPVTVGTKTTNAFQSVVMKDRHGAVISVTHTDTAVFTAQSAYRLGDIDGDGDVDVCGDFTLAMKLAVGQREPTAYELMAGDIDGDGAITKNDATLIKRIAFGGLPINPDGAVVEGGTGGGGGGAGGYEVTIGNYEAARGASVQAPVSIDTAAGIASINLRVNFDSQLLSFQSVATTPLTAGFAAEYNAGEGFVDVALSSSTELTSGMGDFCVLTFLVKPTATIGALSGLTLANLGLGSQYGQELTLTTGTSVKNGTVLVILPKDVDSDGDGISDYDEARLDGSNGYNPWNALTNPDGGDMDINNPDTDGDGMLDGAELTAGTNPFSAGSLLGVASLDRQANNPAVFTISWPTIPGKTYKIELADSLLSGFTAVASNINGNGATMTYSDTNVVSTTRFFRIKVR